MGLETFLRVHGIYWVKMLDFDIRMAKSKLCKVEERIGLDLLDTNWQEGF